MGLSRECDVFCFLVGNWKMPCNVAVCFCEFVSVKSKLFCNIQMTVALFQENVTEIFMMNGQLTHIQEHAFESLLALETLTITNTPLSTIGHDAFAGIELRTIHITNSHLSEIPYLGYIAHCLIHFNIDGNDMDGPHMTGAKFETFLKIKLHFPQKQDM